MFEERKYLFIRAKMEELNFCDIPYNGISNRSNGIHEKSTFYLARAHENIKSSNIMPISR